MARNGSQTRMLERSGRNFKKRRWPVCGRQIRTVVSRRSPVTFQLSCAAKWQETNGAIANLGCILEPTKSASMADTHRGSDCDDDRE
jgi:hypothetical protein